MAILASDIIIKSMLEAAINDLRANSWILEDIFAGLAADPLAAPEAGWKEVKTAIDWFLKTDIPIILQHRIADKPRIPCISIAYMPSREMEERASLADEGLIEDYDINRPGKGTSLPLRVTKPFTPDSYNNISGRIKMPKTFDTSLMGVGQYLVSSKSGKAYKVLIINNIQEFTIESDIADDFTDCYVVPKSRIWNVHRELTFMSESYSIGCHTQNDPATTIWLWQVIVYSVLRYKEAFLEGRGFELSGFDSSALERNAEFSAENVFSKYITLRGHVQADWIKFIAPKSENISVAVGVANSQNNEHNQSPEGTHVDLDNCKTPPWGMVDDDFITLGTDIEDEDEP
jgi:hypothetical protein